MAEIGVKLGGDNSAFRGMLDDSSAALGKFGRSVTNLLPALSGAAVLGFFKTVIDKAGALQDLSDRLGVATDELQAFQFAVTQAGGTAEQANQIWDKARKAFDGLAAGTPEVVKQFERLHLSAKDFVGLDYPQALELTAKAYKQSADEAGAYEAFVSLLGEKSSPRLMAALMRLADVGFPALNQALIEAGGMIDKHAIQKMDDFGDRLAAAKDRMIAWGGVILGAVDKTMQGLGGLASSVVNVFEGRGFKDGFGALSPQAEAAVKAINKVAPALRDVAAEQKKAEKEAKARESAEDKIQDKARKQREEMLSNETKLVKLAMERAKAQGAVTTEFSKQLSDIQKMGGAGQGGFQATSTGGKEGTTTVSALENVLANAKKAVDVAYKNINDDEGARNLVEAKALVDQSERNLLKAQNQQGIGSPVEILISGLDFTSLKQTSDAAFGTKGQEALDRELLAVAKENNMSTKDIQRAVKVIEGTLLE